MAIRDKPACWTFKTDHFKQLSLSASGTPHLRYHDRQYKGGPADPVATLHRPLVIVVTAKISTRFDGLL